MKTKIISAISLLLTIAFFLTGCTGKDSESASLQGTKAPDFTLKNYDGTDVRLSDFKGKIVVLEWFNYECPFCRYHYETETTMADLTGRYKDKKVVFLAVNSTAHQVTEKNKAYAEEYQITSPILDDRAGKVGRAYGAKTTPHMFIIDPNGMIVYDGAIDNTPLGKQPEEGLSKVNYVSKALDELIAGKKITVPKTKPYGCTVKYAN